MSKSEKFETRAMLVIAIISIIAIVIFCLFQGERTENIPEQEAVTCSSETIRAKIREWEGFTPTAIWDVFAYSYGYGHTSSDIQEGDTITENEAIALFNEDIKVFDEAVAEFASAHNIEFTQNEFDALVSFCYNLGAGAPKKYETQDHDLIGMIINKDTVNKESLLREWERYCHANGVELAGLKARRQYEANLFVFGQY